MRILLLHPKDSPRYGPWSREKWDLIVDLGHSSESTAAAWERLTSASVFRLESLRRDIEDARAAGDILRAGFGELIDQHGLDWWELVSLFIHEELETSILLRRMMSGLGLRGDIWATRMDWPIQAVAHLVDNDLRTYPQGEGSALRGVSRLTRSLARLKLNQIVDILGDKYDGDYSLRSRIPGRHARLKRPTVLLPSAYTNVSRTATAYAALLPDLQFLLVSTRGSARSFEPLPNVSLARLSTYAERSGAQDDFIRNGWRRLRAKLETNPELELLARTGVLERCLRWLHDGPAVRDAWLNLLDREPISAVLCGDDSNLYTRLPVLLARTRSLPTVDFHHGALDGRFLLKRLSSDTYLAKSEMEKDYLLRICKLPKYSITVGAPLAPNDRPRVTPAREEAEILFFSEPYESGIGRTEEVYRDLLPPLCELAIQHGRRLVIKLHPFESVRERSELLNRILSRAHRNTITVLSGPLSEALFSKAWFGITLQSTAVSDCAERGLPCFLCTWPGSSSYGYVEQYLRFGLGIVLRDASEIRLIPVTLSQLKARTPENALGQPISRQVLRQLLGAGPVTCQDPAETIKLT